MKRILKHNLLLQKKHRTWFDNFFWTIVHQPQQL